MKHSEKYSGWMMRVHDRLLADYRSCCAASGMALSEGDKEVAEAMIAQAQAFLLATKAIHKEVYGI